MTAKQAALLADMKNAAMVVGGVTVALCGGLLAQAAVGAGAVLGGAAVEAVSTAVGLSHNVNEILVCFGVVAGAAVTWPSVERSLNTVGLLVEQFIPGILVL